MPPSPANETHTHAGNAAAGEQHIPPGVEGGSHQLKVARSAFNPVQPVGVHLAKMPTATAHNIFRWTTLCGAAMPSSSQCLWQEVLQQSN